MVIPPADDRSLPRFLHRRNLERRSGFIRKKGAAMIRFTLLAVLLAGPAAAQDAKAKPDFADVKYGPHERNVLDFWKAKGEAPAPLVLFIHGGGFRAGDKKSIAARNLKEYLDAGYAVAAINYRFTNVAPAPAQYLDCARALQFVRSKAKEWNFDPTLVASTGGSAGAGTSMWLAFHDDLADPKSEDPVARQSTRLTVIAVDNGQSSYDPRFAEKIGLPRPNFERHEFFLPFYGITKEEIETPKAYERYEAMAPITYLTKDDPPAHLAYGFADEKCDATSNLGLVVHHPRFGIALKERMDALGIECVVQYKGQPEGGERISPFAFIKKHIERARQARGGK
jgi:acetyl esterase/lipase